MDIVWVVEKIDNEMIKTEISSKIDELTSKSMSEITIVR